ncbi:class I SAM-dependent methyltransferase [Vreelandella utahensis]|uniref:class I SAM-dependent methyltransferase n=1 Tax=Vreelandella halophila TaxID=86177 RepID=UPI0009867D88|nr:class I SAM-dependent methyltransferase [Halomonas utahensis]
MVNKDYWATFWRDHGVKSSDSDAQSQVLRTHNKQPIDEKRWISTLNTVRKHLQMTGGHRMLDLCSGNGLFARHFAPDCDWLLAVDISPDLLRSLDQLDISNVETIESDMRAVDFPADTFDRILLYAALQYLEPSEAIKLLERAAGWLEPGGILYLGDVPDRNQLWNFFNTKEREAHYFRNLRDGEAIVGTWFDSEWLCRLGYFAGFSEVRIIEQPEFMIYHTFRYEAVLIR